MAPKTDPYDAAAAVDEIAARHDIDPAGLWQAVADALLAAYFKLPDSRDDVEVRIDPETFAISVLDVSADPAGVDVTPDGFGRIAARVFRDAVDDHVAAAVRQRAVGLLAGREGTVVDGVVTHVNDRRAVVEVEGIAGVLPVEEQIPGEALRRGQRVAALLVALRPSGDDVMLLSRSRNEFIARLMVDAVPEVADGRVEVLRVVRNPGRRAKVLVAAAPGVHADPAALVIGPGGSKIRNVTRDLGDERLDVVPWYDEPEVLVAAALGVEPGDVRVLALPTDDQRGEAEVRVPTQALARVVGSRGTNVHLAERLTGFHVDLAAR
jgi:N utilization substance protein A